MAFLGISRGMQDEIDEMKLEKYKRNIRENTIIYLGFAAEDEHGDNELLLFEQDLLSGIPSSPQGYKTYTIPEFTGPIPSGQGTTRGQNDIVYFDHDTLEKLELHQTGPLQRAANTKTIAVHWLSLRTQEKLKETLMTVYSRLRNIERIIIVVDHSSRCTSPGSACHRILPLGQHDASRETILEFENEMVNWCTIGRKLQETIRNRAFWQECNRQYALEQILPIGMRPLLVPRVCLGRIVRGCDREEDPRPPPQLLPLVHDLAPNPADINSLWNLAQPGDQVFTDYSLQDLLD